MHNILVLFSLFVAALARPHLADNEGTVSVTQSTLGTYKYIVQLKDSSHFEERFPDGSVIGEYTILGDDGKPRTFKYTSGVGGFKIIDGPVPVAPVDNGVAPLPVQPVPQQLSPVYGLPPFVPVEDTPEVKAAKAAFYAVYKSALDAAAVGAQ
ncbi:hypothetical protein GWI33_023101 [Rhynchophorus ferrugineus]|uniref:Uncharacterized protein n=1 Tax=Rhynchophorus ferrugineus TaxID=354439 RepID=A0A834IRN6_RHYFE|nr:hypothetical protein GWI33_023101 [Rhynchophorus ferrugineus]